MVCLYFFVSKRLLTYLTELKNFSVKTNTNSDREAIAKVLFLHVEIHDNNVYIKQSYENRVSNLFPIKRSFEASLSIRDGKT